MIQNSRITDTEYAITYEELKLKAGQNRYYSYDKHEWLSIGWLEWLIRKVFAFVMDSPETSCLRCSWKSIEKMPTIPQDIEKHIEGLLLDSLYPTNPISQHSRIISRIFCKTYPNIANGRIMNQMDIQQHPTDRSFGIFYNTSLCYLVANSQYGQLDFYNTQDVKISINDYDVLFDPNHNRIGRIKLAVDYPRLESSMKLYSGQDVPLAKVEDNKDRATLIFRDAMTHQLLAISNLSKSGRLNWTITILDQKALDQKQMTPLLLAWTVLKYSQHYYFKNPVDLHYVKGLPRTQNFIRET